MRINSLFVVCLIACREAPPTPIVTPVASTSVSPQAVTAHPNPVKACEHDPAPTLRVSSDVAFLGDIPVNDLTFGSILNAKYNFCESVNAKPRSDFYLQVDSAVPEERVSRFLASARIQGYTDVIRIAASNASMESKVIATAEAFVHANGYVCQRHADSKKAEPESVSVEGQSMDDLLASRAGTLLGSACGVVPPQGADTAWLVVFCYDPPRSPKPGGPDVETTGRAVSVDVHNHRTRIIHQDFLLNTPSLKRLAGIYEFAVLLRTFYN